MSNLFLQATPSFKNRKEYLVGSRSALLNRYYGCGKRLSEDTMIDVGSVGLTFKKELNSLVKAARSSCKERFILEVKMWIPV